MQMTTDECIVDWLSVLVSVLRPQVGHEGTNSWSVYSVSQVQIYGLWCQVLTTSDIGDWYYPTTGNTPDGFTLVPTSDPGNNVPYQSLKCTNQIGLVVDGDVTNNQGIVRCSTVLNLDREANFFGVYSDNVYNDFGVC